MKRQHPKADESSSDEDEGRFQEAAVDFKPPVKDVKKLEEKTTIPSLRRDKIQENEVKFESEIQATPEFRKFVANKLFQVLEGSIRESEISQNTEIESKTESGIKLFAKSTKKFIPKTTEEIPNEIKSRPDLLAHRKKSINDEKTFQTASVSPQWVLEQQGVYGPEHNRSKLVTEM